MKNHITTCIVAATISGAAVCGAVVQTDVVDGLEWSYSVSEGEATIGTDWVCPAVSVPQGADFPDEVEVPSRLGGYNVTRIGPYAFQSCGMSSVRLPNTLKEIASSAFALCGALEEVSIPCGVTNIGACAFVSCPALKRIMFEGNAPALDGDGYPPGFALDVSDDFCVYVKRSSIGWGVDIPGTWHGAKIAYMDNGPGSDIVVEVWQGKYVSVPKDWIESHHRIAEGTEGDKAAALRRPAANGRLSVAECYVIGLDPEDETNDFLIVSFPVGADGRPDAANIVFDPPKAKWNVQDARPVLKAAEALDGDWHVWDKASESDRARYKFFRLAVELP